MENTYNHETSYSQNLFFTIPVQDPFKCINIKRNSKSKKYEAFKNKLLSEFKK